jgi:hypothetical protein
MGNGDGTFQTAVSYSNGDATVSDFPDGSPDGMVAGDFTGHGNLDLAISDFDDEPAEYGTVAVLPGNGNGTFGAPIVMTGVNVGTGLAAADFNNDGHLDLAAGASPDGGGTDEITILLGNGDGTFQYAPSLEVPLPLFPNSVAAADLNGDGIPDLVALSGGGFDGYVSVALGNGNGTFATPTSAPLEKPGEGVVVANFAGGSTPEIAAGFYPVQNSPQTGFEVFAFPGDFSAQAAISNVTIGGATANHSFQCSYPGDSHYQAGTSNLVNETFSQLPTPVFSLLVGVYNAPQTVSITDGYNGAPIYYTTDGSVPTANSTPYTGPIPVSTTTTFKAVAILLGFENSAISEAAYTFAATPAFSPPSGSYATSQQVTIADTTPGATLYYTTDGTTPTVKSSVFSAPVTVSGQVTLQAMAVASGYINSVVATGNYTAGTPVATTTALQASSTSLATSQQVTLTATVTGNNPTGNVTFAANGTTLGTGAVSSGNATLQTSFATAGSYSVTAAYGGDNANAASTSAAVTVVVASPDYGIQAQPGSATINPGQSATFTFTVSATGGYSGTISFSCGSLPNEASCTFSPASVNLSGATATSTLTISTTAPTTSRNSIPPAPWTVTATTALAGIAGIFLAPVRRRRWARYLRGVSLGLLAVACAVTFAGCGGGGGGGTGPGNGGTPAGSYTVSVNASASGGGPQHAVSVTLVVQ